MDLSLLKALSEADAIASSEQEVRQILLEEADRRLKFTPADNRIVMEETTARLILLTRRGN